MSNKIGKYDITSPEESNEYLDNLDDVSMEYLHAIINELGISSYEEAFDFVKYASQIHDLEILKKYCKAMYNWTGKFK